MELKTFFFFLEKRKQNTISQACLKYLKPTHHCLKLNSYTGILGLCNQGPRADLDPGRKLCRATDQELRRVLWAHTL